MKIISKLILMVLILSLVACGKKTSTKTSNTTSKTVSQVLAEADANHGGNVTNPNDNNTKKIVKNVGVSGGSSNIKREAGASSNIKRQNSNKSNTLQASDIDVDLTRLSSTMVYSEVYNMMNSPESYVGKMVRMNGNFAVYKYPERNYYTCIIKDATACCQQGMEFLWRGNHNYPDDYPKEGSPIIVTGIFDIYYEGDQKYCQLKDAYLTRDKL